MMKRKDYIVCSPSEMDDILYDIYPDKIVSARINSSKDLIYFWDEDNEKEVDFDEVVDKISKYLGRVIGEPLEIKDIYHDSVRNFTLLIRSEII